MSYEYTLLAEATDNEPLINRAYAAYARSAAHEGLIPFIPANDSYLCELGGKRYVVLHNINGILAVYRVRPNGLLKYLRRWPRALNPAPVAA